MKEKNKKKIYFPDLERLLFIHDKILTEIKGTTKTKTRRNK